MPNDDVPDPNDPPNRAGSDTPRRKPISRRQFLMGAAAVGAASMVPAIMAAESPPADIPAPPMPPRQPPPPPLPGVDQTEGGGPPAHHGTLKITLNVNGEDHPVTVEPRTTLLSALRHRLDPPMTGTKEVCDRGNCGACTVDMDGRTVYACMILAADAAGKKITTIEGIAPGPASLHPIQEAFIQRDALQCGFCTPGFIMSVRACLKANPNPTEADVRHACAGNICRCGTYPHIFEAAIDAARTMKGKPA